jgi:hypothetical protein
MIEKNMLIGYFNVAMRMAELTSEQIIEVNQMLSIALDNTTSDEALAVYESLSKL